LQLFINKKIKGTQIFHNSSCFHVFTISLTRLFWNVSMFAVYQLWGLGLCNIGSWTSSEKTWQILYFFFSQNCCQTQNGSLSFHVLTTERGF
jgi:hypothetical protein